MSREIAEKLAGRYKAADYATPERIKATHYDRLREFGYSRDAALDLAKRTIDKQLKAGDENAGGMQLNSRPRSGTLSGKFRVPFDWEK